jgi:adiponectin receptor
LYEVAQLGETLKKSLVQFQQSLESAITSSDSYDWIDIYQYFDNHPNSVHLRALNDPKKLSRWPIVAYLVSAIICLGGSTVFHLFYCMSHKVNRVLLRLDYAGICILIFGSCFPPVVYGFYCQPSYYQLYLTVIGVTSLTVFVVSMMNFIHTEKYRKLKSLMYASLGLFAGFPIVHLAMNSYLFYYDFNRHCKKRFEGKLIKYFLR